ncbi:MAG: universal stress protein [Nitrospirota bacterium]
MKILLATDGSEYSEHAAEFLTRLQWSREDAITVFHAIYEIPFQEDGEFHCSTLRAIKAEIAPRILDSAVAVLKPVKASISVEIEESLPVRCTPEQCIIDAAKSSGADLIVMGARGIKGIASALIGSVTRLVAIKASQPVMVVKPASGAPSRSMKILFATDGSDTSRVAGEFLTSIPFPDDAEVTIVNIVASSFADIPERFVLEINERIKEVVADARTIELSKSERIIEQARADLRKRFKKIQAFSKVGDPSTEILKIADTMQADLVAVGSRGFRGIKGMLGSVSRNILTHSKGSVLIGKSHQE